MNTLELQIPSAEGTCFIRTFQNGTDVVLKPVFFTFTSPLLLAGSGQKDTKTPPLVNVALLPLRVASPDLTRNTSAPVVRGSIFLTYKQRDRPLYLSPNDKNKKDF